MTILVDGKFRCKRGKECSKSSIPQVPEAFRVRSDGSRDRVCKECRNADARARLKKSGKSYAKKNLYMDDWSPEAQAFYTGDRKWLERNNARESS